MKKVLVIGASGFVGKHLSEALLADGYAVRGLARNPAKADDLTKRGGEMVRGDISDLASLRRALRGMDAVYVSVHTLSPQHLSTSGQGFMDIEKSGLQNIVTACQTNKVRRLLYLTSLGVAPDAASLWTRKRWKAEQFLLGSGLDVTVLRPGQIVGKGGMGFDMMVSQAQKSVAFVLANGKQKWRNIAVDDLIYYLIGVLGDARTFGHVYDVGGDVLTNDQMIDITAEVLNRPPPRKIHFPRPLFRVLAPLIERMGKLPHGALVGLADSMNTDAVGDPLPLRQILPRPPLCYRTAVEKALL